MPSIDVSKCVNCGLCRDICPVLSANESPNKNSPKVYALWSKEDRTVSSSGGAFSAFARLVLNEGGFVYGAAFDENFTLRHIEINNIESLKYLRGSKYVQSEIDGTLKQVKKRLKEGKKVLFCGTPCQVAGLKSYLRKDYDGLITIDLVCHGVPSGKTFKNYMKKLSSRVNCNRISRFEFRRLDGWGKAPSVELNHKLTPIFGINNLYMCAFDKSALFRLSCYQCPYASINRVGDCTIGDFWGLGRHGIAFKHDIMKGVSLVLANNHKGLEAVSKLSPNVFLEERTLQEAIIENHNLQSASPLHPQRTDIIAAFNSEDKTLDEIENDFHLIDRSFKGLAKMYADQFGVFDYVKRAYNWVKTLKIK